MAKQKFNGHPGLRASPKGYVTVDLPGGPVRLRLTLSEVADADEYLGKALVAAMMQDPLNFHNIRVAFFFGVREINKDIPIPNVKAAGKLLVGADLRMVSEAILSAMREGGIMPDEDKEESVEEPAIEDHPGEG